MRRAFTKQGNFFYLGNSHSSQPFYPVNGLVLKDSSVYLGKKAATRAVTYSSKFVWGTLLLDLEILSF